MLIRRRQFLSLAASGVAGSLTSAPLPIAVSPARVKTILFDAFAVFDPRPIAALAESLFPGRGPDLTNAWRTRQFGCTWLRAASRQYEDFWRVTEDALAFAAEILHLDLSLQERARLMGAYLELQTYPDVRPALQSLKEAGHRLAFLANLTPKTLEAGVRHSGLEGVFDQILSTDRIRTYKPDPRAYQIGVDAFKLRRDEILFVPSAGWDAAGARWFSYQTFWVNRTNQPAEELGVAPDGIGSSLADLMHFVMRSGA
jgi:2-haloacid dehalogenase